MLVLILLANSIIHISYGEQGVTSPRKQIDSGIPTQIITCSNGLKLIYKSINNYPACVKPQTAQTLIQYGWGISHPVSYLVKVNGFLIPYQITGGNMSKAYMDKQSKSLIFSTHVTSSGVLNTTLPRALIDTKLPNGNDDKFYILMNGQEIDFTETKTTTDRILSIPFQTGTEEIEIIYGIILP